jgi:hypothetical protein
MKHITTFFAVMTCLVLVSGMAVGQSLLLEENFDYLAGDTLGVASSWVLNSPTTGPSVSVLSGSLSYSGYPSSAVGNSVTLVGNGLSTTPTNGQDVFKTFVQQSTGTIYASFLMNVTQAPSAQDYFFHFSPSSPSGKYQGRLFIKAATGGFQLGLIKTSGTVPWTSTIYPLNTTVLVVLKYVIVTDATGADDYCQLFVNPALGGSEPVSADITTTDVAALSDAPIGAVQLRQGGTTFNYIQIDGIRVGTSWNFSPLPVELASFSATTRQHSALLRWTTATETNCFGFELQRKEASNWQKIGFVAGAGTSTSPRNYNYTDADAPAGLQSYRINQIDKDGASKIIGTTQVEVANAPKVLTLGDNYPNPFNPSTKIAFTVPSDGRAVLRVFNIIGQEVAALFDGAAVAGQMQTVTFDASQFATGIYFARLDFGNQHLMHKMMLVK